MGSTPIKALAIQIWAFCAVHKPAQLTAAERPGGPGYGRSIDAQAMARFSIEAHAGTPGLTPTAACRRPGYPGPDRPSRGPVLVKLVVAFLPFPTRLVAEALHHVGAERVAVTIYRLTLLAIRLLRSALDACARREHLFSQHGAREKLYIRRRLLPVVIGYVIAILIGLVVPQVAVALFFGIAVYQVVPFREVARLFRCS